MSFKIISDSSSNVLDLPIENYCSVPLKIILGDKEYVDNTELDVKSFVEEMSTSKEKCSTSCPNVFDWLDAFEGALSQINNQVKQSMNSHQTNLNNNQGPAQHLDPLAGGPNPFSNKP